MPDAPEAHRLGPHVVGTRVVVRRVLPGETGPTGGPALTDVLGTCLRWSDGECVVQPESGPAVTIPWRLIVSGKPVPPRPSVRHRASPREVQLRSLVLWPGLTTEPLGDWVLRAAPPVDGRRLRRANSALAMGDAGVPLPDAERAVRAFYARHDRAPIAMVELDGAIHAGLSGMGWEPIEVAPVRVQLASVARAARACGRPPDRARLEVSGPRAEVHLDGAARGRAAVDGDWVGLHGVQVQPDRRRSGLAREVVATLLDWAASQGATTAWLHVESDNPAGLALWESLGFRTHHTHRYLSPGG
ncbi:GNAT family N-acetyltransferase [Nocardioides euryhalodurans]|uniref:GNAT family N-acetyltransferase n=1 Tax=Nocardioides euryhalodurans TaxID=2518370 RepID=A0A4P7GPG9_9ACTN|nr:GNAT family N-acetyltransferase [Nocardioides euryhalodurans]QBR93687.1 GNAT family N-acetyltransferase [Nocardioides euryhalodurans]